MKLTVRVCPYVCLIVGASSMILPPRRNLWEPTNEDRLGRTPMDKDFMWGARRMVGGQVTGQQQNNNGNHMKNLQVARMWIFQLLKSSRSSLLGETHMREEGES